MTGRVVVFNNIVAPYMNRLYNRLAENEPGFAVVSAAATEPNRAWGDIAPSRFEHEVLPGFRVRLGPGRFAYLNRGIFTTLNRLKPRLLVINGFYPTMVLATIWAMLTRTRLMLAIDGWAETMPNSLYHRIFRPFVLRRCRAVITCGLKGRDYFLAQGFSDSQVKIVPLVPAWDPPAEVPSLAERAYDLLWCGHLNTDVKNAGFLVALCAALQPTMPGLRVRIVGKGPAEAETLARLRERGIDVTHDPALPWDRMTEVFTAARLFVFPSLWEPWGLVCNEAMQCGTPALVSPHVGAGNDLVLPGVTGEVLPLDAALWAQKAQQLLADPQRWKAMSEAGRAEMRRRSLEASVAAYRDAINAAAG